MRRSGWKTVALRRFVPMAALLLGLALFFVYRLDRHFSFELLSRRHGMLATWIAANPAIAQIAFVLAYALVVAFSLPVAALITPLGGFLFGPWVVAALSVAGATADSIAVFLAARSALHEILRARVGSRLTRLSAGFARDDFYFLLLLRFVPIFPFWLVNIVPALVGMRLGRYTAATLIGITLAAFIYAGLGAGFGALVERGEMPSLDAIFEARFLWPLLGLGTLSLIPIVYRRMRNRPGTRR